VYRRQVFWHATTKGLTNLTKPSPCIRDASSATKISNTKRATSESSLVRSERARDLAARGASTESTKLVARRQQQIRVHCTERAAAFSNFESERVPTPRRLAPCGRRLSQSLRFFDIVIHITLLLSPFCSISNVVISLFHISVLRTRLSRIYGTYSLPTVADSEWLH